MPKVFISAGHGGPDAGASYHYTTERDEMIKIVDQAVELLAGQDTKGYEIHKVPHTKGLIDGVQYINSKDTPAEDFCIEVHMNANAGEPGTGIECYYGYKPLADALYAAAARGTGLAGRQGGTRGDPITSDGKENPNYLHFNRETTSRSALLELGFINNANDLAAVREKGAQAVADGILEFLGGDFVIKAPDPAAPVEPDWFTNQEALETPLTVTIEKSVPLLNFDTGETIKAYDSGQEITAHYRLVRGLRTYYLTQSSHDRKSPTGFLSDDLFYKAPAPVPAPEVPEAPAEETPSDLPLFPIEDTTPSESEVSKPVKIPSKLTSRKLWMAILSVFTSVAAFLAGQIDAVALVTSVTTTAMGYMAAEGYVDGKKAEASPAPAE